MLEKEKGISKEVLFEALEVALISAYKRNFQTSPNVRVVVDRETGEIKVYALLIVAEEVENPQQQVELYEARVYQPRCQIGDEVEMEVTPKEFGRIAAQTAKQVVIQRIREAERELIYESFVDRVEDIITGLVQRFEQRNVIIDLGKVEAILPAEEQIPRERYRQGERVKTFIKEVKKTSKGPQIIVSRTHSGFLKRLFEVEVPEIYEGIVEIKAAAREPGYRSKIAVWSKNKDIDPVGACVGPRGTRVQAISNELKGEKIDIIKWNEDTELYIAGALSPAKVAAVELHADEKRAIVIVPDNQLSLAIGKEGQNARLSAKITGWRIDISSETQIAQQRLSSLGLGTLETDPSDDRATGSETPGEVEAAEPLADRPDSTGSQEGPGMEPIREEGGGPDG
jgi:transcription termination/antitermination protein NusA